MRRPRIEGLFNSAEGLFNSAGQFRAILMFQFLVPKFILFLREVLVRESKKLTSKIVGLNYWKKCRYSMDAKQNTFDKHMITVENFVCCLFM